MDELIEALTIFKKYAPDCKFPTNCWHDTMGVPVVDPEDVSEEDTKRLDELGFFVCSDLGTFISYRFGSC